MKPKILAALFSLSLVTGCANQAAQDYYLAMNAAAVANSNQQEARYRALASVAESGDATAAIAATMAIAMTRDTVIAPQYVESEALSFTRVLAAPVAAVAGLYIQADVSKNASDNATRVQLGTQSMVTGLGAQYATATANSAASLATATGAVADLGRAGFDALNTSSANGYQVVQSVSENGYNAVIDVSQQGFDTTTAVSAAYQDIVTSYNELIQSFDLGPTVVEVQPVFIP